MKRAKTPVYKDKDGSRLQIALCNLERELPDWAVTALAAGWTAPKSWKP